jgi:hypothetical protein
MSRANLDPLPADFFATWTEWFPGTPPVGFLLREAEPDRWLRIHSLPGSRRHPTSGRDHAELLRRHNAVATDLLGEGGACAVVLFDVCDPQRSSALGARAGLTESELARVGSLPPALWDEDEGVFVEPVCLFGGSTVWRAGGFDAFIAAVADDRVRGLFVALETGAVYAPYDGGADLIFPTSWQRDLARDRYEGWLSSRHDGL